MPIARSNGISLYYEDDGVGEPLLMVMGIGAQLLWWPPGFVEALRARGFRTIRFDNRDNGLSERMESAAVPSLRRTLARRLARRPSRAPYTLVDMAGDAAGLLGALGLNSAHVLGASMGGMIAQELALAHPGRVRSLTSIMSNPGGLRYFLTHPRALGALLGPAPRSREAASVRARDLYRVIGGPDVGEDLDWIAEIGGRTWERSFYPVGFKRQFAAILATPNRSRRLGALSLPTLVVHGAVDPLVPTRGGRATAAAIPGARYLEIGRMGHDLPRAEWDRIAGAVADLARVADR